VPRSMAMSADMKPSNRENIRETFESGGGGAEEGGGLDLGGTVHKRATAFKSLCCPDIRLFAEARLHGQGPGFRFEIGRIGRSLTGHRRDLPSRQPASLAVHRAARPQWLTR
jgi:hypothetical protein